MLDPVGITPVSKIGFGSVQIPCTSTQDPTSEVLCALWSLPGLSAVGSDIEA